jgi:4-hydroxy-4-methyl-2-oxoglutarate aldolase
LTATPDEGLAALCTRLVAIPVAVVSDVMTHAGLPDRVLAAAIRQAIPAPRFAGPALCFSGRVGPGPAVPIGRDKLVYEADRRIRPGDVVALSTGGFRTTAVLGGNTLAGWRRRGCAAVVSDGLTRDLAELTDMPVHVAGVTPVSSGLLWSYTSLDEPIDLPGQTAVGVRIEPGDVLHGDADGVIVIPRRYVASVVGDAEIAVQAEHRIQAAIAAGLDRGDAYLTNDRFGHVRKAAP